MVKTPIKENTRQQQFINWLEQNNFYTGYSDKKDKYYTGVVMAIPNGGKRQAIDVVMLKKEGMLVGASDIVVAMDNGLTLWIEFKTDNGKQSQKQKDFQEVIELLGHKYYLVYSCFEAVNILKSLLT